MLMNRKRGGYEEERKEHSRWNRAERKKVRDGVNGILSQVALKSIDIYTFYNL